LLNAAAGEVLCAALHPQAELRPRDGAAAWVRRLEHAFAATAPEAELARKKGVPGDPRRLALLGRLEAISPACLLDTVMLHVKMPKTLRPSEMLPHGARCEAVVDWVEQQGRIDELQAALETVSANGPL
jgi:hypothetical protein